MTLGNWQIEKVAKGFRITDHKFPVIASHPYIPKRRNKVFYPSS